MTPWLIITSSVPQPDRCTAQSPLWIATPGQIGLRTGDGDWSPNLAEPIGLDWSLHRWIATTRWRLSKIEIRFTILYFRNRMNNNQLTYISLSPPLSPLPLSLSPSHTHTHTYTHIAYLSRHTFAGKSINWVLQFLVLLFLDCEDYNLLLFSKSPSAWW